MVSDFDKIELGTRKLSICESLTNLIITKTPHEYFKTQLFI
jgi:hypothetical protein